MVGWDFRKARPEGHGSDGRAYFTSTNCRRLKGLEPPGDHVLCRKAAALLTLYRTALGPEDPGDLEVEALPALGAELLLDLAREWENAVE
jgi:hypothetical protein